MTESGVDLFSPFGDRTAVGSGSLGIPVPSKQVRIVDPAGSGAAGPRGGGRRTRRLGRSADVRLLEPPGRDRRHAAGRLAAHRRSGGAPSRRRDPARRPDQGHGAPGRRERRLRRGRGRAGAGRPDRRGGRRRRTGRHPRRGGQGVRPARTGRRGRPCHRPGRPRTRRCTARTLQGAPLRRVRRRLPPHPLRTGLQARAQGPRRSRTRHHPRRRTTQELTMTGPSTTGEHVDVDVIRDVAVLTLDRPGKLNALDVATRLRLAELIRGHGAGDTVRGIVLTGRGRAFSAGRTSPRSRPPSPRSTGPSRASTTSRAPSWRPASRSSPPSNGLAVGGASEITLSCDARIGTPATEYFQPENARGLTISNATSLLLPRLVGNNAMRMVLASPRISADEALRIGLLDEVVEADGLLDRAIGPSMRGPPDGGTTALHLALLRPLAAEVEAAFAREDAAAHESWTSGLLTAGVAGFWNARETTT
ncbi:hypothetical protein L7F22_048593 [Adiantum nelumboides]|nr:hypothetical protein [Adiantum nelumboides]